jgi:hypothetical protein
MIELGVDALVVAESQVVRTVAATATAPPAGRTCMSTPAAVLRIGVETRALPIAACAIEAAAAVAFLVVEMALHQRPEGAEPGPF